MCGVTLCYIRIYCCYNFGVKPYLSPFLCFSFYNKIISNIYSNTFKTKSDMAIIFASTSKENLERSKEGISIYLSLLFFSYCTLFLFDVPSVLSFLATHFHTYSLSETY